MVPKPIHNTTGSIPNFEKWGRTYGRMYVQTTCVKTVKTKIQEGNKNQPEFFRYDYRRKNRAE